MAVIQPIAQVPFVDSRGLLTSTAVQFLTQLQLSATSSGTVIDPTWTAHVPYARTDAEAAAAGVPLYGLYHNYSALQVRQA